MTGDKAVRLAVQEALPRETAGFRPPQLGVQMAQRGCYRGIQVPPWILRRRTQTRAGYWGKRHKGQLTEAEEEQVQAEYTRKLFLESYHLDVEQFA